MELWCECLGKDRSDMKKRDAFELESVLRQLGGWELYSGNASGNSVFPDTGCKGHCKNTGFVQRKWTL